jgi:uncharacterized protein YidB (DUF937 family)
MGMLDGLLGSLMGGTNSGAQQQQNPMMQIALQLLQQNGGVAGIVEKFRQAGYGQQANSWVGTGENQPIAPDALQQVLGSGDLSNLASKLGVSHGEAAGGLAAMLPQLIDHLTPQGQIVEGQNDPVGQLLASLQRSRGA